MPHHERRILLLDRDAGAHRATADAEVAQVVGGLLHATKPPVNRAGIRGEFLAEPDGHRVLEMRAARLHDVVEFPALARQRIAEALERMHERVELRQAREPDIRRNRVVGALRHVDVIVGMHGRVGTPRAAKELVGTIGQHLVHVHVVRRPGTGLVRIDDELFVMPAGEHLVRSLHNGVGQSRLEAVGFLVRQCRRLLDPYLRHDERPQRGQATDREVLLRAHRLHSVERIGGDFPGTEGIRFRTGGGGHGISRIGERRSARRANHLVTGIASACAKRLKKLNMAITAVISTICAGDQCAASS